MLSAEKSSRLHGHRYPLSVLPNSRLNTVGRSVMAASDHLEHIWIVTGPAGCGKTTVGQYLSKELNVPYVEGDDFHPPSNKAKMGAGQPLTDADRWDWLITLREEAVKQLQTSNMVVVTCSALKHKYRDVIRIANYEHPTVQIHFIYLKLDEQTLLARVAARAGHYMKQEMVHSQMMALEEPDAEWDVLRVDVRNDRDEVQRAAAAVVQAKLKEYDNMPGPVNGVPLLS